MNTDDLLDRAVVARIPVLIKARSADASGRRIVEVEASTETIDVDGDMIMQDALLKSAPSFINSGHLDIDHLSEFGYRMGIPDPASYIVGRPISVKAGANRTTFVEGEISKSIDGVVDPTRNRYDEFWQSLQRDPPVVWFSSIYGWPTELEDFSKGGAPGSLGVTRWLIKAMDWRSLAFTRSPKNTGLTNQARIVTAKSYLQELVKSHMPYADAGLQTMAELAKAATCTGCAVHTFPSLRGYRQHFITCKGVFPDIADVYAHAVMHRVNMQRALSV